MAGGAGLAVPGEKTGCPSATVRPRLSYSRAPETFQPEIRPKQKQQSFLESRYNLLNIDQYFFPQYPMNFTNNLKLLKTQ